MTTKQLPPEILMRIALFDTKPSCTNCKYVHPNKVDCTNETRNTQQHEPNYWEMNYYCSYFDPKPPK